MWFSIKKPILVQRHEANAKWTLQGMNHGAQQMDE